MSDRRGPARLRASQWMVVGLVSLGCIAQACHIQGADSGECQDPDEFEVYMPFCRNVVRYRTCVPRFQALFPNHTITAKDEFVRTMYTRILAERLAAETNATLREMGTNEFGVEGKVEERFTDNDDCANAFRNYFCWINFPRCDAEDRSLIMCRSVCENFFTACRYSSDLYRCGAPEYYGGEEPEQDEDVDENGQPIYWRAQFPGQPFRDNEFDGDDNPRVVCTPSIKDGAVETALSSVAVAAIAAVAGWLASTRVW